MPQSAAQKRALTITPQNIITDKELEMVAATMGEPRQAVAKKLGRSVPMVTVMRRMVRNGDKRNFSGRWTKDEDDRIREFGDRRVPDAEYEAAFPDRSANAVRYRRSLLGARRHQVGIGKRTVVAKTCPKCGLLKAGEWFSVSSDGRTASYCRPCGVEKAKQGASAAGLHARVIERGRRLQDITAEVATRSGYEYTSADLAVLEDRSITDFQKALALGRSLKATTSARQNRGFRSSVTLLSEVDAGQWLIE